MLRFFYKVIYEKKDGTGSEFNLGIFSTKANANLKIDKSLNCPGFNNKDCFKIIKFGVKVPNNVKKSNLTLYSVVHEYSIEENDEIYDIFNVFDIFSTKIDAKEKITALKEHSRLGRKYPNNFEISEIVVDNFLYWSEGYTNY